MPSGLTVAFSVAPVRVTEVAGAVDTAGGGAVEPLVVNVRRPPQTSSSDRTMTTR